MSSFPIKKLLNFSAASSSFEAIKKDITIIDFFGTWCVPCIKALPHLKEVQEKYKDKLQVVLVSIEEEEKLKKFIGARSGFSFPVAVDTDNSITNLFNPPSYPFTVVLNREGNILATLTDAAQLTDKAIENWMKGAEAQSTSNNASPKNTSSVSPLQKSSNSAVQLSQEFIYAAKTGEQLDKLRSSLEKLDYIWLTNMLKTDNDKKAFWINIYNGYTYAILKKNPDLYKDRSAFFKRDQIKIAGQQFSLDDIEHGILRRSRTKWSLGYIGKMFPSKREKELRVTEIDYRIHFALNCGAKSCPPIAYYTPERLDEQLDMATKAYLAGEAEYKSSENTVYVPALMSWFRADFGGKKGTRKILAEQGIIPAGSKPKIDFKSYDWNLYLDNFR